MLKMEKKVNEKETYNEIKKKYVELKKTINKHNKLYYQDNNPEIKELN